MYYRANHVLSCQPCIIEPTSDWKMGSILYKVLETQSSLQAFVSFVQGVKSLKNSKTDKNIIKIPFLDSKVTSTNY